MPKLTQGNMDRIPIVTPPLPEQRAIAHILGTLDDKIELNRRMNETLEAMARALFKSWFVDFDPVRAKAEGRQPYGMDAETAALFHDSFEDSPLGEVPRGWRVGKLRECCLRVENGGTPRRDEPEYWEPGTVPWLTSGEVRQSIVVETENFISEEGLANSSAKLWPSGTTVVALYGATAGQVCFLAKHMCANQACCGLISAESTRFYLYLYTSSSVEAFIQQARGSAQQNLSQQIVADFPTLIPASEVLKSFENRVRPLFEKWIANLNESRTLAALRDTLLPKLLSGEIRVKG
jgi:type I restriction enzyme S subunit